MKRQILFLLFFISFEHAFGCNSDFECGYGNRCVKASGTYGYSGSCVTPTDQYGNKDYSADRGWGRSGFGATAVPSCSYNTDCGFGFKCMKESGQLYGICVK